MSDMTLLRETRVRKTSWKRWINDPVTILIAIAVFLMSAIILISFYMVVLHENPAATIFDADLVNVDGNGVRAVDEITVSPGDVFYTRIAYCKYTDAPGTIKRTWTDDLVFTEPVKETAAGAITKGCGEVTVASQVPSTLPQSRYNVTVELAFQVNFLAKRSVSYTVGEVVVVAPP